MNDRHPYRRALALLAKSSWSADKFRTLGAIALRLGADLGDIGALWWTKVLIDRAEGGDVPGAVIAAVGCGITLAAVHACNASYESVSTSLRERTLMHMDVQIIELVASLPGVDHHERPELLDRIELIQHERWGLGQALPSAVMYLGILAQVIVTSALLFAVSPWLLALPVAGYIMVDLARRAEKISRRASEKAAPAMRMETQLEAMMREPKWAGEVRMQGMASRALEAHEAANAEVFRRVAEPMPKTAALDVAGNAILTLAQMAGVAFVGLNAVNSGSATPGDVMLVIGLVLRVGRQVAMFSYGVQWFLKNLRAVGRLVWLTDEVDKSLASTTPAEPAAAPARLERGITLRDVNFNYPGNDRVALSDINLHIPAGHTVALVGENGAGKTTLVKLLCRFYEPTSGEIAVDGVTLGRIPVQEWRTRLSGAFQDFARFELIAGEVVGLGDLPQIDNRQVEADALERAGAGKLIRRLGNGLDTPLGTSLENGVDLSGGQWQQLALGRAMMRPDPLLLVMDEPTAALDPETEHELFERYAAESRSAADRTGAVTILVSHRFSTVRMADVIVVLEDGRVTATGSHEELMSTPGLYSELFSLQANAYR